MRIDYSTVWVVYSLLRSIWTSFPLRTITDGWQNYEVSVLQALFRDTLDETSHCGRYPAIVQSRVHFLINLWFRPRKAAVSRLKRAGERELTVDKMTPCGSFLASISHLWFIACILTVYQPTNTNQNHRLSRWYAPCLQGNDTCRA